MMQGHLLNGWWGEPINRLTDKDVLWEEEKGGDSVKNSYTKTEKLWALRDLNPQPMDYESTALTVELRALPLQRGGKYSTVSRCLFAFCLQKGVVQVFSRS